MSKFSFDQYAYKPMSRTSSARNTCIVYLSQLPNKMQLKRTSPLLQGACILASFLCVDATTPPQLLGSSVGYPGNATSDYIVVKGGTAGLTVAARLAEDPTKTVAVVEAGSFYEIGNGNLSQIVSHGLQVKQRVTSIRWLIGGLLLSLKLYGRLDSIEL